MDSLLESALNAAAFRPENGTVSEAFQAQDMLRLLVKWHERNTEQMLPTELMVLLVAARRVC
jgi:hypothetical protein